MARRKQLHQHIINMLKEHHGFSNSDEDIWEWITGWQFTRYKGEDLMVVTHGVRSPQVYIIPRMEETLPC